MGDGPPPSPTPGVRLVVDEPDAPPRLAFVAVGARLQIGRSPDLDVPLSDVNVSRVHAVITFDGVRATVLDLGSRNRTYVDERPVEGSAPLRTGDVIRLGGTRISVVLITTVAGAAPPAEDAVALALGPDVVALDPASVAAFGLVARLARSRLPVLLQGETGSGKEVAARELHRHSPRAEGPFVALNCATLMESLAESELFGHEKGAFTGATARRLGAFEAAQGGTLFLDEVGELSDANQARLLRALQERCVVRVGSSAPVSVDVRVVAATNRDLLDDVRAGRFRQDLYFRLNGASVEIPPLRARVADIEPIARRVLAESGGEAFGPGVAAALQRFHWPGNIRELRHAIERALAVGDGRTVTLDDLPLALRSEAVGAPPEARAPLDRKVDEAERRVIVAALEAHDWNQTWTAKSLGISRRALIYRMERLGLKPPPASAAG